MWVDWYKHLSKNKYIVNDHGKYEDGNDVKQHIDEFLKVYHIYIMFSLHQLL